MNLRTSSDVLIKMLKNDVEVLRERGDEHDYSLKEEKTPFKKEKGFEKGDNDSADKIEEAQLLLDFANSSDGNQDGDGCTMVEPLVKEEQMDYEYFEVYQDENGVEYTTAPQYEHFSESERSEVIKFTEEQATCSKYLPPASEDAASTSKCVPTTSKVKKMPKSPLGNLEIKSKTEDWLGKSIFADLPAEAATELDFLLRFGHSQMIAVIKAINAKFPIDINYNPNKSNARLENPSEHRNQNNSASRRSRLRKKFQEVILLYFLQYTKNENAMLERQEIFCNTTAMAEEVEVLKSGLATVDQLKALRVQCGLL